MARLVVPLEERLTDPDTWHPRMRRRVTEWAEARVFWTRRAPWYPTREARAVRAIPRAAVVAMKPVEQAKEAA